MHKNLKLTVSLAFASLLLVAVPTGRDSKASVPTINPIAMAISKLQPKLSKSRAKSLSIAFAKASHDCKIPWQILVSIAFNESSLGVNIRNDLTHDYGIMQINRKTSLRYGLAQDRILGDEAYSLAAACKVLADNKARYSKKVPYWIGIYRSGTRLGNERIRDNAIRYDRMVRSTAAKIGYREYARAN